MANIPDEISRGARRWAPLLLVGALAGLIASVPMAWSMMGMNRLLSISNPPLPPKKVTARLSARIARLTGAKKLAFSKTLTQHERTWGLDTWLAHLGYGAATASLYPLVTRPLHIPDVLRGMLFALTVWATSYLGWLPALSIVPPATEQSARRNAVVILSHLVWGSLIGLLAGWLPRRMAGTANT